MLTLLYFGESMEIVMEDVCKSIGNRRILDRVNLKVKKGEIFGIFGPTGSGKTTILRLIAGLEKQDSGVIKLRGKEVSSPNIFVPPERRNVGFVFQNLALWPHMTVFEHLNYVCKKTEKIGKILKLLKLDKLKNRKPAQLSGGERQRLAIARCLAQGSDILLLDEPFSSLDLPLKKEVQKLLFKLNKRKRITILLVTHDIFEINCCNRVGLLRKGKMQEICKPSKIFSKCLKFLR